MTPETLTIIPAKSRSRRIKNKNTVSFLGKPLVLHTIEQAIASGVCGEICVATDCPEIATLAKAAGAKVPFLRKDDVDDITSVGVAAKNTLVRYREELNLSFSYLCLLLATSPLREPADVKNCRAVLEGDEELDAAMSVVRAEKHPYWAWSIAEKNKIQPLFPESCHLGSKDLDSAYYVDGSVYWARTEFFEKVEGNQYEGNVGAYVLPSERAVDIDTPLDLKFAEFIAKEIT